MLDSDTLHLCEEVIGIFSSLPSHTRVLHSSKWEVQISHQPAVGPHQTCLQPLGHPVNLPHILGPHCGWQTVTYTIAPGNSFILSIKGADAGDGTKDLLLHDTGAVRYACDDRRRHEVSRLVALREVQLVEPLTAVNYATFWFGKGYIATNLWIWKETSETSDIRNLNNKCLVTFCITFKHLLQVFFTDERSIFAAGVRGDTSLPLLSRSHKPFQELRVNTPLYINPAGTQADFTLRGEEMEKIKMEEFRKLFFDNPP